MSKAKSLLQKSLFSYLPPKPFLPQDPKTEFVSAAFAKSRLDLEELKKRVKLQMGEAKFEKPIITPIFGWFRW